jgi:tetratricopeptide (TPR) repeat protein
MIGIKKIVLFFLLVACISVHAQDVNVLLKEASNFEKQLKETEALEKYTDVLKVDDKNIPALVKCTELNVRMGARQTDKNAKANYYHLGEAYARKGWTVDSNNADVDYAMALVSAKLTETADENKEIVGYVRQTKLYVDRALAINPNHGMANYTLGKWHFEMVNLSWVKKAAVKALYGGLPKGDIDSAIFHMEKCRSIDQYFVLNYLDLAKAYDFNSQPAKAMDVLNKLIKLPNRTIDDAALKEEGKKMLEKML